MSDDWLFDSENPLFPHDKRAAHAMFRPLLLGCIVTE